MRRWSLCRPVIPHCSSSAPSVPGDPSRCLPRIPAQHLPSALGAQVECAHSRLEGLLPPRAASLRALPWGLGTEWAAPIPWAQQWPGGGPEHHRLAPPPFQGQAEAPVPAAGMWAHCPALFGTHEARVGASGPHIAASCGKDWARVPSAGSTGEGEWVLDSEASEDQGQGWQVPAWNPVSCLTAPLTTSILPWSATS